MSTDQIYDDEFYIKYGDPRMHPWFLMDSPLYSFAAAALYLLFVKVLGPAYMRGRQPYDLKGFMVVYNFALVGLSGWMTYNYMALGWLTHYRWRCQPIDFSDDPQAVKMAVVCWVFHLSKLIEMVDTVIFVLRKKDNQITGLHVYHHATVPITSYYGVKFGPGGWNTIFPLLNTFVHTFMYLYYAIAAMGPKYNRFLWWKKYMTSLQLTQFTMIGVYTTQIILFPVPGCRVTLFLWSISAVQAVIFFVLFAQFYVSSYKSRKDRASIGAKKDH